MPDFSGRIALIADDEEPILLLAQASLEQKGFTVLTASTGRQAIDLARDYQGHIDLLLMDIVLPDINGPELAEKILEYHPESKMLFTSGYGVGAETALKQRHSGAVYLKKPFGIRQLHRGVEEALATETTSSGETSSTGDLALR